MTNTENYRQLKEQLEQAALRLKSEFIGIDKVIDEIIDAIASWFFFPDIQEKPMVINLWGMTGVGKTDLVRRLAHHLDFNDKHFEFDLGKNGTSRYEIEGKIEDVFGQNESIPVILSFDEFQLGRTIDQVGGEIDRPNSRLIWEIIDTGKIKTSRSFYSFERLYDYRNKLHHLLDEGVEVENGIVIKGKNIFIESMEMTQKHETLYFIQKDYIYDVFDAMRGKASSELEIREVLNKLDGPQTLEYLTKALKHAMSPKLVDLSKSIIFIMGNMDEAFSMSHDFDGDIDADQFHRMSLKIDVQVIKKSLQKRFRSEQIARLGSNHIIYPAFSRQNFLDIIDLKLTHFFSKLEDRFKIRFEADASLNDMIFNEGVFPAQGVRPVLSCIDQNVKAKMGKVITKFVLSEKKADKAIISCEADHLLITFYHKEKVVLEINEAIHQKVRMLRKNNMDDEQALIAVHEAGHAVISMVLLQTYPEEIFSQSMDSDRMGFLYANFKWETMPRKRMLHRIAYYLGGIVAEEIIFGKDMVSGGSSSDLSIATSFVTDIIRRHGLGEFTAVLQDQAYRGHDVMHNDDHNEEIRQWLNNGKNIARDTLYKNHNLLVALANYLSDHRTIKKSKIAKLVKKIAPKVDEAIKSFQSFHKYREVLKGKLDSKPKEFVVRKLDEVQLNKDIKENK